MDATRDFQDALTHFVDKRTPSVLGYGKVKSYDSATESIVVIDLITDLDLYDVSLKTVLDTDTEGVVLVPAIGSMVIVGSYGKGRFTVLRCSKVERIKGKIGGLSFDIASDGIEIKQGNESFKQVLSDFIQEVFTSFTAINGMIGLPINTPKYPLLKTRLAQILK